MPTEATGLGRASRGVVRWTVALVSGWLVFAAVLAVLTWGWVGACVALVAGALTAAAVLAALDNLVRPN